MKFLGGVQCVQYWLHPLPPWFICYGLASWDGDSEVLRSYVLCQTVFVLDGLPAKAVELHLLLVFNSYLTHSWLPKQILLPLGKGEPGSNGNEVVTPPSPKHWNSQTKALPLVAVKRLTQESTEVVPLFSNRSHRDSVWTNLTKLQDKDTSGGLDTHLDTNPSISMSPCKLVSLIHK